MSPTQNRCAHSGRFVPRRVAYLLCGGLGTRLRGVTDRPKAVLEIAGWPFLRYHLERLRDAGIERFVFLTGHGAEEVERVFGPAGEERLFLAEESPLGTGGALAHARAWAGEVNWIANGDSYTDVSPAEILEAHERGVGEIVAVHLPDGGDYGRLRIGTDRRITGFVEKGAGGPGWINAGLYLLDRPFLEELPDGVSSLERDLFPRWAAEGRLRARPVDAFFRDIGTAERLRRAQEEFVAIRVRLEAAGDGPSR